MATREQAQESQQVFQAAEFITMAKPVFEHLHREENRDVAIVFGKAFRRTANLGLPYLEQKKAELRESQAFSLVDTTLEVTAKVAAAGLLYKLAKEAWNWLRT